MAVAIIGYSAAACSIASNIPQFIQVYKTKNIESYSVIYIALILVSCILWIAYGVLINDKPTYISRVPLFILMAYISYLAVYPDRNPSDSQKSS